MLKPFAFFFLARSFMHAEKLFSSWNALYAYMCLLVHVLCLPSFLKADMMVSSPRTQPWIYFC